MADEAEATEGSEEEAQEEAAPAEKTGSGRLILFLVVGLVLAGGGGGAYWMGLIPGLSEGRNGGEELAAGGGEHGVVEMPTLGPTLSFEPFIVNLADEDVSRYLKAKLEVEFYGAEMPEAAQALMPQIRDSLLTLLTSKTFDEIRTPEGKQELREEIIARLNQSLKGDVVKGVYFTEFIVQ